MKWARNVHRIISVVKWSRLQYKSVTGNKKTMPYAYDGEMMLQYAMDGEGTNSQQHLHESGECETKVYSNVTKVKRRTF